MPAPRLDPAVDKHRWDTFASNGWHQAHTADALGLPHGSFTSWLFKFRAILRREGLTAPTKEFWAGYLKKPEPAHVVQVPPPSEPSEDLAAEIRAALKQPKTLTQLTTETEADIGLVLDVVEELRAQGVNIHRTGEWLEIVKEAAPSYKAREPLRYLSRPDNTFVFGAFGDQHVASKYARYDVMEWMYDLFAEEGADRVFNTGNWIEGEARFNKYDLEAHGLEAQCRLLSERFPKREGLDTYAIWGDDHEGWYAQREGVDVGKYAENVMHQAGRNDWHDIGFMEAHVELINANTGAKAILAVVHPGGGSAYALSYAIQKIIESLEGGEKPDVGLYGHYHKLWSGIVRNVWVIQTGCGQDQTVFMRKRRLEAHVGGALVTLKQDPETGAILRCRPELSRYFNQEWYTRAGRANKRWSYTDKVTPVPRSISVKETTQKLATESGQ